MTDERSSLRYASPNEQRTISREDLGFYHAVIIGVAYEIPSSIDVHSPRSFYSPLKSCIGKHPCLSVVVEDADKDKSSYHHVPRINLEEHIVILDGKAASEPLKEIEQALAANLDTPFPPKIPPWKIAVLPLPKGCLIAFCFSHTIGDGITGVAFHRTLLRAWRRTPSDNATPSTIQVPHRSLPPAFDTPANLPISWSYLLAPLISLFIPSFLAKALGLRPSASAISAGTWTGAHIPDSPTPPPSKILLRRVDAPILTSALHAARKHNVKLTGLFLHLAARALSSVLPADPNITDFVSQTAINMRKEVGISNEQGGNFASGCYIVHARQPSPSSTSSPFTEDDWLAAQSATQNLALAASTLQDQPIGLLRYLSSMRKWMLGKLGQRRDCSFEVSNVGVFPGISDTDGEQSDGGDFRIAEMVFAQPGQALGAPLAFNLASVKDGALVYSVTWRAGALEVGKGEEEGEFVRRVCEGIERGLAGLE
ncbi:uncharacterized protein EI97DRAFT_445398 [Westerdykella ornata]|uniref:Alcohol acetyltransferase n=1 Tax=Westerdykella ornata TaxID=318751 RepID=A0A6A6JAE7_WESOR|nr:uncharacterized protein EI97DRAFT_445398 [Westerdykella ornata]KAF2272948.1 hypothetical protein EI97DRAFT_445398 [Westerdykella ornata]